MTTLCGSVFMFLCFMLAYINSGIWILIFSGETQAPSLGISSVLYGTNGDFEILSLAKSYHHAR
jgi:hypothetical protein